MKGGAEESARVRLAILLVILLGLTGCLPSSCHREESRALLPSDSLSRVAAAAVPVDTLVLAWEATGTAAAPLQYPRTVAFGPDGTLYVSDAERRSLYAFGPDGQLRAEVTGEDFGVPYLAGGNGDTVAVFFPEKHRIDYVAHGRVVGHAALPAPPRHAFQYAAATADRLFLKAVTRDDPAVLYQLSRTGEVLRQDTLPGPYWRHAGLLRAWGDSLLSLSGFRPVVDVVGPDGRRDTLALHGFDSPMLARSRSFLVGAVGEAPLLTPAAAPAGAWLFVLNLRPGWLRIDAYDRQGRLQRAFIQPDPGFNPNFRPQDLAARRLPDGRYALAVVATDPMPRLRLYHTP